MKNAKRLRCGVLVGAVVFVAGLLPASGQDAVAPTTDASHLADFSILAVKPEGDEKDYSLVPVGEGKVDVAQLKSVLKSLPDGFLGIQLSERDYDEAAEVAQCQSACNANAECRQFEYVRPTSDRPVGLCRLKRSLQVVAEGTMSPVADEAPVKSESIAPQPTASTAVAERPTTADDVPPPPTITKPMVLAFPLPPRAELKPSAPEVVALPAEPPATSEPAPPDGAMDGPVAIVPPPTPPVGLPPVETTAPPTVASLPEPAEPPPAPPQVHSPTADLPNAAPLPVQPEPHKQRGLPLWLAVGSVAFMLAGAGVYRHSYQKRMLTRMTVRLVNDGIDARVVEVEKTDKPDMSLRFIVRSNAAVTAPDTRILAIADGAFA